MERRVFVIDTPNFYFVDLRHLFSKLKEEDNILMCVVNEHNELYKDIKNKLRPIFEDFKVQLIKASSVDHEVVKKATEQKLQVVVVSNDRAILQRVSEQLDYRKLAFAKVLYRQANGRWNLVSNIFSELQLKGYPIYTYKVLNRIEGALARILGLGYERALTIVEKSKELRELVLKAKERVVPLIKEPVSFEQFIDLCEEQGIFSFYEDILFLLALENSLKLQKHNSNVFITQ